MGANGSIATGSTGIDPLAQEVLHLNDVMSAYDANDVGKLATLIKTIHSKKTGNTLNIDNDTLQAIAKMHADTISKITTANNGQMPSDLSNESSLYEYFRKITASTIDTQLGGIIEQLKASNFEQSFITQIESILTVIKNLNHKYKYFEYKFIELNLFIMAFIPQLSNILEMNMKMVLEAEKLSSKNVLSTVESVFNGIISASEQPASNDATVQKFISLQKHVKDILKKESGERETKIKEIQQQSFMELLNILMDQHESVRKEVEAAVNISKAKASSTTTTTQNTA